MSQWSIPTLRNFFLKLQNDISNSFLTEDPKATLTEDRWERPNNSGDGITRAIADGPFIEKAGVNFSHVRGTLPSAANNLRPDLVNCQFEALGVSVIIHPRSPYAPTSHFNVRFFTANKPELTQPVWWFGGGFDLTPHYGFEEDCIHWHQQAQAACLPFGAEVYPQFKKWADDYFYLKHRNEARGIGGIFFDDLNEWGFEPCFEFIQKVGQHYIQAYQPILNKRKAIPYTEKERAFQSLRRGRYVEFNLLYDRGTLFGMQYGGRTESILISLPPEVSWRYDWQSEANSIEAQFSENYLQPRDWLKAK